MKLNALVITGYGINCEKEMALACRLAGFEVQVKHTKELLNDHIDLDLYHFLCLPGGFSFGDELGAGKAFVNRLSYASKIKQKLQDFTAQGKCILGICNGFQVLVKLGLLPGFDNEQVASLTFNDSCRFESRWAHQKVADSRCVFTKNIDKLHLPVRHGEGKFVVRDEKTHARLLEQKQIVLRYSTPQGNAASSYPDNPNGSLDSIAGICDETGRIFGLMPHPEAALFFTNHPDWTLKKEKFLREKKTLPAHGDGFQIFQNVYNFLKGSFS